MCENNDYRDCNYNSNYLSMTKQKHDKIADDCQRQSRKNCMTRIMNKQIANSRYGEISTKRELYDIFRKENCRFLYESNSIIISCYLDRPKPVLLRIVNWFFGGCPEASRRHQEQIDEVGKEEIFKSTNTWLL
ncbi:uncharacterized protein LOC126849709 [Cataglyphis hispanica]|uniref:uncharacterized protein LOC126849709 n=1 Tax=Cataglyphis hispanica TaxID=1086592 RepID=UPI00217F95D9|nr:uncharacterized protein LOC126849709 [Cataglyphis hispanica]